MDANKNFLNARVPRYRPPSERGADTRLIHRDLSSMIIDLQGDGRCTDCGIPFCSGGAAEVTQHFGQGCPAGKNIPDWIKPFQRFIDGGRSEISALKLAWSELSAGAPLSSWTGHVCPAPCEQSCVHAQENHAGGVNIRDYERLITALAREHKLTSVGRSASKGKKVAVVGSGPAGYAAAWELARKGHQVVIYEAADRAGGLARYGIPNWHLSAELVDWEFQRLQELGVEICLNSPVGGSGLDIHEVYAENDAFFWCTGARKARKLGLDGEDELEGVHPAMSLLEQNDRLQLGDKCSPLIDFAGKQVLVTGLGYTSQDCIASCLRGHESMAPAENVTVAYYRKYPSVERQEGNAWPEWPRTLATFEGYPFEEYRGTGRLTELPETTVTRLYRRGGKLVAAQLADVTWGANGKASYSNRRRFECDLLLTSVGFQADLSPLSPLLAGGGIYQPGVFTAGDASLGASFVISAIADATRTARSAHTDWLTS